MEEKILWDCLHRANNWRTIHSPDAGALDADAILDLARSCGYPEEVAQQMATSHAWNKIKRGALTSDYPGDL